MAISLFETLLERLSLADEMLQMGSGELNSASRSRWGYGEAWYTV